MVSGDDTEMQQKQSVSISDGEAPRVSSPEDTMQQMKVQVKVQVQTASKRARRGRYSHGSDGQEDREKKSRRGKNETGSSDQISIRPTAATCSSRDRREMGGLSNGRRFD